MALGSSCQDENEQKDDHLRCAHSLTVIYSHAYLQILRQVIRVASVILKKCFPCIFP